jgi:hypothetical protein
LCANRLYSNELAPNLLTDLRDSHYNHSSITKADSRTVAGLNESGLIYLAVMVGIIVAITAFLVPALLWKKCGECGTRNMLDATECKRCKKPFPADNGPQGGRHPLQ